MNATRETVRILHVDADPEFADEARKRLEDEDDRFEVVTATSAQGGRDRLATDEFDCAVSGYELPDEDGISFLGELHDDVAIPLVLYTDRGTGATAADALDAGVTECLPKRFGFELLAARIADAVDGCCTDRSTAREERERQLEALHTSMRALLTADDRAAVASIGVEAANDVLGLKGGTVYLYDDAEAALVPVASTEAAIDLAGAPPTYTRGESITWRAYERGVAGAIDDVRDDPNVHNEETTIRSQLNLPLDDHGILVVGSTEPSVFDEHDVALGGVLARNVVVALEQLDRERELTRKNERLEEFTSVVSHDLRNPLGVAMGRLELAREECSSEHLADVDRALSRIETLLEELLALTREGTSGDSVESVALATVADRCWRTVETVDATLVVESDLSIRANRSQLRQLFENLFRNAVEHGGGAVTVTVGKLDDEPGFYVADDGPGVASEARDRIFESGYSTAAGGTGLGLAIVQRVVDDHGWEIRLCEGRCGGARFEIVGAELP